LIYSNTTRLLATMGTRPDEMPAGSRYLAPIKIFIASTFGKSKFIKKKLIPALFNVFFKEKYFDDLFEKYRPDLIFLPHLIGWFDLLFLKEAKAGGIKTIGMVSNWDHIDKYFIPLRADKFLCQNEPIKKRAIYYQGYEPHQVSVVGYPHFDFILRKDYRITREEMLDFLNFPKQSKYFLYISGSVYCPDEPEVIEQVLKWLDEGKFGGDVRLVIRPYLGGRFKDKDFDEKKFKRFSDHPRVFMYQQPSWNDLPSTIHLLNIMNHADEVMTAFSTAALEVSLFDRPLISIGFDGFHKRPFHRSVRRFELFTHFQDLSETGAIKVARNFNDLFRYLDDYLKDPALDAEKRELMRQKMCYKLDGMSSERIFSQMMEMI